MEEPSAADVHELRQLRQCGVEEAKRILKGERLIRDIAGVGAGGVITSYDVMSLRRAMIELIEDLYPRRT